jgi:hypothetical protein
MNLPGKRTYHLEKEQLTPPDAFKRLIVAEIVPATTFSIREDYHYLEKRELSSCHSSDRQTRPSAC